jgi:AhpD family alkylhydroperoxidase
LGFNGYGEGCGFSIKSFFEKIAFYKIAPGQVRYLSSLDYGKAEGLAGAAIEQMERDFVVGPPITVHLPNPELMAGVWSMARECLAAGRGQRARGEVVAAAIARLNQCPYCLDIHTSMLHSHGSPGPVDAGDVASWAAATLTPGAEVLGRPPFSPGEAPLMVGTAVCFHYLNRMVNVFLHPSPFLIGGDGWIKDSVRRMAGNLLRPRLASQLVAPGVFLSDVSEVALPAEFAWASSNPQIAGGFLRFIETAEQAGIESVDPAVRECVLERVQSWRGETPGLGRDWVEKAVAALDERKRAAGRLALTTALASWQVDERMVAEFRLRQSIGLQKSSDRDLINLTSWASYVAARRIASWTGPGPLN